MSDKGVLILKWPLQRRNVFFFFIAALERGLNGANLKNTGTKSVVRSLKNGKLKPLVLKITVEAFLLIAKKGV